jgi:hypothetical protein
MSYFKPLNSYENNLNIIRVSIDQNGNLLKPSQNQLPYTFQCTKSYDDAGNLIININYPNVYNTSDIPSVFVETLSDTTVMYVSEKTSSSANISSSNGIFSDIDVVIIGTQPSGPVFAVSNRGWKYSTKLTTPNNNILLENLIYSDMLVGINTDNPTFNITTAGNIGYVPNEITNTSIDTMNLLNNYLNIIDINTAGNTTISLPEASNNGQLLNITIGNVIVQNTYVIIDTNSNIINNVSNRVLQNKGDTISLCSYNNQWLITGYNVQTTPTLVNPAVRYNSINASTFSFNSVANGLLTVLNLDANLTVNMPEADPYNGYIVEMVVGNVAENYSANLLIGNIITNQPSINLSNISDKIKLLGTLNGWLVI